MLFLRVIAWYGAEKISLKKSCFYLYIRREHRLLHNHTYSCISQMRRYRSNLQALFLVHPAAFIQVAVDQKQEYNC